MSELKAARINDGQLGMDQAYLNVDLHRNRVQGSLHYNFRGHNVFTHIPVVGTLLPDKSMQLELSQPERTFYDDESKELRSRPPIYYKVEARRDTGADGFLRGTIYYQSGSICRG